MNKIETEKKFSPKVGNIDFAYDIFAESVDHRAVIEMQRVEYDYHFDRFLHYHHMAIAEQQQRAEAYKIDQVVYTIVILTAPYSIRTKQGIPVQDEMMISGVDPHTLRGDVREIYGHKLIFLNPQYRDPEAPPVVRDWLKLIYASIHKLEKEEVDTQHRWIQKAVDIIDVENLSPIEMRQMKEAESRRRAITILETEIKDRQAQVEQVKQQAEDEKQRADSTCEKALEALLKAGLTMKEARKSLDLDL